MEHDQWSVGLLYAAGQKFQKMDNEENLFFAIHTAREGTLGQNLCPAILGPSQNGRFDVRIQELVSKVQNPGGFLRKNIF